MRFGHPILPDRFWDKVLPVVEMGWLLKEAGLKLGLTKAAYVRQYGYSKVTATKIVESEGTR